MSVIIFIVILAVIVVVHELGHFLIAKSFGVRVDEFGLGLPPKILTLWKKGETTYTLNAIPFGGFVKIFGENPDEESIAGPDSTRSLVNKPRSVQAAVLVAGVTFNVIFAWLLISAGFMGGMPTPVGYNSVGEVRDARLVVTEITIGSPADKVGIKSGDAILGMNSGKSKLETLTPESVQKFILDHGSEPIAIEISRGKDVQNVSVTPTDGVITGQKAIGIGMDLIGTLKLPMHLALWEGAKTTYGLTKNTAIGLVIFIRDAFIGRSNLSQITGPVGIVGIVSDVTKLGFVYLISFTAFISLNLAVINLIPFPALDGGRLLFVLIEAIKGRRINPKISNVINNVGFALLILLMVVVTFHDITKLIFH